MKYISLIRLMDLYGQWVKEFHAVLTLRYPEPFNADREYMPFFITESQNRETGQVSNLLVPETCTDRLMCCLSDKRADMPPVLEIEWMRGKMNLDDEQMDVVVQLSYLYIWDILDWIYLKNEWNLSNLWWRKYLEDEGVIIEVEELKDVPAILGTTELWSIKIPSVKTWTDYAVYGTDFEEVLCLCRKQTNKLSLFYYHLPILLSMFLCDYERDKLGSWTKRARLDAENMVANYLDDFTRAYRIQQDKYTYYMATSITDKDIHLLTSVFSIIDSKLKEINSNMGLISFWEYEKISEPKEDYGPQIIKADVRLTYMDILWSDEIRRVEAEKEAEENEGEDVPDDALTV